MYVFLHNEASLLHHLELIESCKHFYEEKGVASGLLYTMSCECITKNKSIPHTTPYVFNRYSTDGISDKVQLNLKDDTIEIRVKVRTFTDSTIKEGNIHSYMTNSRALAGIQENNFSSTFHLEENHTRVDNEFDISDDQASDIIDLHNDSDD